MSAPPRPVTGAALRPRWSRRGRPLTFSARFAIVLGLISVLAAVGSGLIAAADSSRQTRQNALDRAMERAGLAVNLLNAQRAALATFTARAAEQLAPGVAARSTDLRRTVDLVAGQAGPRDVVGVTGPATRLASRDVSELDPASPLVGALVSAAGARRGVAAGPDGTPWLLTTAPAADALAYVASPIDEAAVNRLAADLGSVTAPTDLVVVRNGRYALAASVRGSTVQPGQPAPNALVASTSLASIISVGGSDAAMAGAALGGGYALVAVTPVGRTGDLWSGIAAPLAVLAVTVVVLALLCVYVLVERDIRGPLRRLDRAVRALTRSDFEAPIPAGDEGEIGRLATRFEAMRVRLREVLAGAQARAEIGRIVSAGESLDAALQAVSERLRLATGSSAALIVLTGDEASDDTAFASGLRRPIDPVALLSGDGPLAVTARLALAETVEACALPGSEEYATAMRQLCAAPLHITGRGLGVVALADPMTEFTDTDRELLVAAADQIALAVVRERLLSMARHQASTDGLTGLYNYRYLVDYLDRQVAVSSRGDSALAVLMLDLDHFKQLNDTCGHQVGDEALRVFARTLRGCIRRSDLPARYGGEEFTVVMANTAAAEARIVAEKIRRAVAGIALSADGRRVRFTVSIGGAAYPADAADARDLLRLADMSLYRAKAGGRDRVCFVGDQESAITLSR